MDYIERLVSQLSDTESVDEPVNRNRLHKPLAAALSPLPQSPFSRHNPADLSESDWDDSSVSFVFFIFRVLFGGQRIRGGGQGLTMVPCAVTLRSFSKSRQLSAETEGRTYDFGIFISLTKILNRRLILHKNFLHYDVS